jgi:thiopurine S-methyltransferase
MQPRYAAKFAELVPAAAPIALISLSYPANQIQGPPFSVPLVIEPDIHDLATRKS